MFDQTVSSSTGSPCATYTARELAKLLQCSLRHVRTLDDRRAIPGRLTLGRLVRFSKHQVDQWLTEPESRTTSNRKRAIDRQCDEPTR
jgi:excisionase family DNA binding protein